MAPPKSALQFAADHAYQSPHQADQVKTELGGCCGNDEQILHQIYCLS